MRLVIADRDIDYCVRLSSIITQKNNNKFIIKVFSQPEILAKHLHNHKTDILLIDANFPYQDITLDNIKLIIYLVEQESINSITLPQDSKYIVKYQRTSNIVKQIYNFYSDINPTNLVIHKSITQGKIVCVFSPSGGSGKTTMAITLSKKYALLGKTVFYLNLESISSTGVYFKAKKGKGMSEVFKSLIQNSEIKLKIEALKRKDSETGIFYFNDPDNLLDIEAITIENIATLIDTLSFSNICDYLIIDMSSHINEINMKVLELANQIVIVNDLSLTTINKWSKFELAGFIYEQYKHKMMIVYNKISEYSQEKSGSISIMAEVPLIITNSAQELTNYIAHNLSFELID